MGISVTVKTKVIFNGKEYASPAEMPDGVRRIYDQAMGAIAQDGNGVPDLLPPTTRMQNATAPQKVERRDRPTALPANPQSFCPESEGRGLFWKAAVLVVVLAIAAVILSLVLR